MTSLIIPGTSPRPAAAAVEPARRSPPPALPIRWSAIGLGALLAVALQIPLMFLGAGIGLATLDVRSPAPPLGLSVAASIFGGLTLIAAFAAGGWITSYFARPDRRGSAILHGLATWAVVAALGVFFVGTQMVSALGGVLQAGGVGLASAASADTALDQLAKMNLQIVSKFDLTDGTVVSKVVTSKPAVAPSKELVDEAKEKAAQLDPAKNKETRAVAEDARDASAVASLVACGALLLTALGAVGGALVGRPREIA